ncbi:Ribosome maturation factor RimM [BD1-7 clade bacterium]|uniref:Ribosome maturation factor RimM n=1 Tax=BD1-7 clade bacterium TaxID=2029982 RepID=A0A5S9Q993_9GAMM|nr:Ribosome maturation factor RimM [BD1-7 clade bacterium]CAA0114604.1 Ribosome maturation factor RimM [BD1-7 clade bacterium]
MSKADSDAYLVVGKVIGYYGLQGWVKVKSFTQPEDNILSYQDCFIKQDGQWQPAQIAAGKLHGKGLVMKFRDSDDRTAAENLGKCEIAVLSTALPELAADDYYWHELLGLEVRLGDQLLGKVSHLLETGANDVLVVKPCAGSIDDRERLLPYRPEVILAVDLEASSMSVDWDPDF